MAWDSKTKEYNIVINKPLVINDIDFANSYNDMLNSLTALGYIYFSILHDKDIKDKDTGELKTLHYHLILIGSKRRACSTTAYMLSSMLGGIDILCIQINPVDNLPLSIQYLTHKNHLDKYQYDFKDIKTNNNDLLASYYNLANAPVKCDEYILFNLVDQGYCETEIMFKIGLGNFNVFRGIIQMLIKEHDRKWTWDKLKLLYDRDKESK